MAEEKKDYILNIRISRDTYDKLKEKACENRETLSNLARKVIDDGLEIIDDLSTELLGKRTTQSRTVLYYMEVTLAQDDVCATCGRKLKKGTHARLAELKGGKKEYVCEKCT